MGFKKTREENKPTWNQHRGRRCSPSSGGSLSRRRPSASARSSRRERRTPSRDRRTDRRPWSSCGRPASEGGCNAPTGSSSVWSLGAGPCPCGCWGRWRTRWRGRQTSRSWGCSRENCVPRYLSHLLNTSKWTLSCPVQTTDRNDSAFLVAE